MDMLQDKRFDFTILDNEIIRNTEKFSKNEVLAYMALSYYANEKGTCFPSYDGISKLMRTSKRTATDAIQQLVTKGVIKVENRKVDKKKEMTSNLYTLVSNVQWETARSENREYLIKKATDYKSRVAKSVATKVQNKIDKKNAPDSIAVETSDKNKTSNTNIIPQNSVKNTQEEFDNYQQENDDYVATMLKESGIKYIPFKRDCDLIESLDPAIVEQAIFVTNTKASKPNWNYFLSTYDSMIVDLHKELEKAGYGRDMYADSAISEMKEDIETRDEVEIFVGQTLIDELVEPTPVEIEEFSTFNPDVDKDGVFVPSFKPSFSI